MSNDLQGKTTSSGPALNWVQKTKVILSDLWSALEDTTLAMGPGLLYQDDDAPATTSSPPKQKGNQVVEWYDLGDIAFGKKLGEPQKTAVRKSGDGPLKYSFTDGAQLPTGDHELSVYAEATDNYNQSPPATAKIKVAKAEQKVEWGADFGEVPSGTKLGEAQKTAKRVTGEGQLKYSFTDGEQKPVGQHKLSAFVEETNNFNASPAVTANIKVVAIEEMAKAKKKETVNAVDAAIPIEMKKSLGARLKASDAYTELSKLMKQEPWTVETFEQIKEKLEAFKQELGSAVKQISDLEERQKLAVDKGQKYIARLEDKVKIDLGKSDGGKVLISEEYLTLQKAMWEAFEIEQNKKDPGLREWMNNVMPRVREVKEFLVGKFKSAEVVDVYDPTLRSGTRYELIGSVGKDTDVYAYLDTAGKLKISEEHRGVYLTAMRQGIIASGSTGANGTKFEPFGWVVKITISTAKANEGMDNIKSPVAQEVRDEAHNAIYLNFDSMIERH